MGVPVPEFDLLKFGQEYCFGSRLLKLPYPRWAPQLAQRVTNPEAIYSIAVFDTWIHNLDRHENNLVVASQAGELMLVAIDHSHCPIHPADPPYESLGS